MKAFFGMTAAAMMVVLSIGTALSKNKATCPKNGIYVDYKKPEKIYGSKCDPDTPQGDAVRYKITCYPMYECKDGVLTELDSKQCGDTQEMSRESCKNGKICQKGQCGCPPAGKMLQVMSGTQKACGCTACNECERCVNKSCVPIKNVSPHSPQCLTE